MSEPSTVLSGVPHAGVSAGFLLFLIYFDAITQIPLSLGSFMDIHVYADYLPLYRNQRAYSTRYRWSIWLGWWKPPVTLNAAKSKVMIISCRRVHFTPEVCLSLLSPTLNKWRITSIWWTHPLIGPHISTISVQVCPHLEYACAMWDFFKLATDKSVRA